MTGATGYLTTHIIHEFFVLGYKVRKSARNTQQADHTRVLFVQHGSSNYDCTIVPNTATDSVFDEAVKSASAVEHSASIISSDKHPNKVIPITVARVTTVPKAAAEEKSAKRFVYMLSSVTATMPKPSMKFHIGGSTWNEESIKAASGSPYENGRK